MNKHMIPAAILATVSTLYAGASLAAITKDEAIEKALNNYPGEVIKAYQETKRGREVWEVKVAGQDGKKREIYYDVETGELVKVEEDD